VHYQKSEATLPLVALALLALASACGEDSGASGGDGASADLAGDAVGDAGGLDGGDAAADDAEDVGERDVGGDRDAAADSAGDADAGSGEDVATADAGVGPDAGSGGPDAFEKPDEGGESGPDAPPAPVTARECLAGQLGADGEPVVDYDAFGPVIGSHCMGTNHQDITGVERVVFVGDSITVGTPPTPNNQWYRNVLASRLVARFGLAPAGGAWPFADVVNGVALAREGGDFASCAKWGARTDDIGQAPHYQIQTCIPEDRRDERTLIVMTVGGNDIFAWAQDLVDGVAPETLRADAEAAVADLEEAIRWVVEPGRFPNGVFVVFATPFDLTDPDGARDMSECTGAGIIAMDTALVDPIINDLVVYLFEEYMRIAVETGTDLAFMGEAFCGHGSNAGDSAGRCYRGPGAASYFDVTCMHPSGDGHRAIADVFTAVIAE
jgi:lysophospholipase L1-like esterase